MCDAKDRQSSKHFVLEDLCIIQPQLVCSTVRDDISMLKQQPPPHSSAMDLVTLRYCTQVCWNALGSYNSNHSNSSWLLGTNYMLDTGVFHGELYLSFRTAYKVHIQTITVSLEVETALWGG